jgi:hypothetical protein
MGCIGVCSEWSSSAIVCRSIGVQRTGAMGCIGVCSAWSSSAIVCRNIGVWRLAALGCIGVWSGWCSIVGAYNKQIFVAKAAD